MKKTKVIIFYLIFLVMFSSFVYADNSLEYQRKLKEAEEIVRSINPSDDDTISASNTNQNTLYSTSQYSIDIPSTYYKVSDGSFSKANGENINIRTSNYSENAPLYNKNTLNKLEDTLKKELYNSLNVNINVEKKELTNFSFNNYKAYHFSISCLLNNATVYMEQYYIITQNTTYIISIGSNSKNSFLSSETINMLKSFTIANYQEPTSSFSPSNLLEKMFIAAIVALFWGIIDMFIKRNKKDLPTTHIK